MQLVPGVYTIDQDRIDAAREIAMADRISVTVVIGKAVLEYIRLRRSDPATLESQINQSKERSTSAEQLLLNDEPGSVSPPSSRPPEIAEDTSNCLLALDLHHLDLLKGLAFIDCWTPTQEILAALDYYLPLRKEQLDGAEGLERIAVEVQEESKQYVQNILEPKN